MNDVLNHPACAVHAELEDGLEDRGARELVPQVRTLTLQDQDKIYLR